MLLLQAFDLQGDNNPRHLKSASGSLSAGGSSKPHGAHLDEDGASAAAASLKSRALYASLCTA